MSDRDRLPLNHRRAMRSFASASDAVRDLALQMHPDWHVVYTHFLGDALPGEWAAAKTNGAAAAVTVASSRLTCTAGTDDNGYAGQGFGLFWKGDWGIYLESEQQIDAITSSKIEVGFTDAVDDAGAVNAKTTPTATADDFVVVIRDTDHNTSFDIISADDTVVAAGATGIHTLVAATAFTTAFTAQNDTVDVRIGSSYSNMLTKGSGGMEGGDLVTPWWFAQARAATANRIFVVEYALCAGPIA